VVLDPVDGRVMTKPSPESGQVNAAAAEVYDEFFVPALFAQWPERVLDAAAIGSDDEVLDVGCGTGVLARAAARRTDGEGSVTGLDVNDGMLAVARQGADGIVWRQGSAESLPFPDRSFDRVVSQFALMFFTDPAAAVAEMARVLRPGGRVTIATWASVDENPGYAAMVDLLRRLFGDEAADALLAPFTIGTVSALRTLLEGAFPRVEVTRHEGTARFDSIDAWVHTDVRGWTLADLIDADDHQVLLEAARVEMDRFVGSGGHVAFTAPALIATANAPMDH
jgi:ubiquinone/menaquinone biosynthesis C-methylase UbiE